MSKELILKTLEELGFEVQDIPEFACMFNYEGMTFLYMPDDDDEHFLRFAVPNIFDVTDENKNFVLDIVNSTNMTIKYSKTCVWGENVWAFYEYRVFSDENIEDIIEHGLLLLKATVALFHRKVEGDDVILDDDDDDDDSGALITDIE